MAMTRASNTHSRHDEPDTDHTQNETGTHSQSQNGRVVVTKDGLPAWLDPVVHAVETVEPLQLSRFLPPANGAGRQSAVLILFGEGARGPELLLM
ncbi:coenzyme A pyrophosphatase, partial [Streptomyces sp. NPDC057927]